MPAKGCPNLTDATIERFIDQITLAARQFRSWTGASAASDAPIKCVPMYEQITVTWNEQRNRRLGRKSGGRANPSELPSGRCGKDFKGGGNVVLLQT
jgi:hypothetical protein